MPCLACVTLTARAFSKRTSPAQVSGEWFDRDCDAFYPDGYEVRVSTTNATPADGLANPALYTVAAEYAGWTARSVSLASYAGDTVYLAFRNTSNDTFLLLVDDVRVACEG